MTIRIIDDELCLTRAEFDAYLAQYNALAAQTQVCVAFEGWVRMQRQGEAWARDRQNQMRAERLSGDDGVLA